MESYSWPLSHRNGYSSLSNDKIGWTMQDSSLRTVKYSNFHCDSLRKLELSQKNTKHSRFMVIRGDIKFNAIDFSYFTVVS